MFSDTRPSRPLRTPFSAYVRHRSSVGERRISQRGQASGPCPEHQAITAPSGSCQKADAQGGRPIRDGRGGRSSPVPTGGRDCREHGAVEPQGGDGDERNRLAIPADASRDTPRDGREAGGPAAGGLGRWHRPGGRALSRWCPQDITGPWVQTQENCRAGTPTARMVHRRGSADLWPVLPVGAGIAREREISAGDAAPLPAGVPHSRLNLDGTGAHRPPVPVHSRLQPPGRAFHNALDPPSDVPRSAPGPRSRAPGPPRGGHLPPDRIEPTSRRPLPPSTSGWRPNPTLRYANELRPLPGGSGNGRCWLDRTDRPGRGHCRPPPQPGLTAITTRIVAPRSQCRRRYARVPLRRRRIQKTSVTASAPETASGSGGRRPSRFVPPMNGPHTNPNWRSVASDRVAPPSRRRLRTPYTQNTRRVAGVAGSNRRCSPRRPVPGDRGQPFLRSTP